MVLPDILEKFISDVVKLFAAALNAVMVHPDAVEKIRFFTFIDPATILLVTFMEQSTFTNGVLMVVDRIDIILILLLLNSVSSRVVLIRMRLVLIVIVLKKSEGNEVMDDIPNCIFEKSNTEPTFRTNEERTVDTSFTLLLVANAPRLTGEYGDTRNGLLLFDANDSLVFRCLYSNELPSFCINVPFIASIICFVLYIEPRV